MKYVHVLLASVLLCAFTTICTAADYTYVSRSWKNQADVMQASLTVQIPVVHHDNQGNPYTTYETRWVYVNVRVGNDAPLRTGEVEYFRVSAYSGGAGQSISVHVDPDLVYHSYRGGFSSTGSTIGHTYVTLFHGGRIKNIPPHTFENVAVNFTTTDAPFTLTFDDFGFADNADATAAYAFEIKRDVFLFPDKLVASGSITRPESGKPTVVITKNCAYTEGADEYFKSGKTYVMYLKVRRTGSEFYSDKWSEAAKYEFKWDKSGAVEVLRVETESLETKVQTEKFRSLHHD